jgi:glycosyltransferase involved in cell wall biosynthesis
LKSHPKILRVETGFVSSQNSECESSSAPLDYHIYAHIPRWWRKVEEFLRLDIYLALQAKLAESQYDIIWAASEKVGIPLSFMGLQKPLVVVVHHLESTLKAKFTRITRIAERWAGIGYISNEGKQFLINYLGIPKDSLFQYESANYLDKVAPAKMAPNGPIMSLGVAKRDYNTLITALSELPEYETELFVSSKFGDKLARRIRTHIPEWIHVTGFVPNDELMRRYQNTRFVVVSLEETTHTGAGINVILEAGAFGKAVIATKTGGMQTFVKNGETGILVPPYDVKAMREAIQKLWTQPDLAHQMGLAARRYVETHFNPETVNSNISAFLDKVYVDSQKNK